MTRLLQQDIKPRHLSLQAHLLGFVLDDTMSIMPAIVGCVQQGSAGNAPTGVSVATSSSGNYDCSVLLDWQNGSGGSGYPDYDGSNGDCLAATIAIPVTAGAEGGDKPAADGDKKEGEDKKPAEEKK